MRSRSPLVAISKLPLLLTCLLSMSNSIHALSADEARADIRSTYNFKPETMTFDEQARRAPSLSALWDRYSKAASIYSDALRTELRAPGNSELLYCDGGMLLLAKSNSADDQVLGLASLQRCSFAEIQHTPYFYTLHSLASKGHDTFGLQARILAKPKYSVFIVQHALSLGQDYAFLYPSLVQDESVYVPRLIGRLREERDPTAQKSLVRALWYAATPESEATVRTFANSSDASTLAQDDARKLLKSLDEIRLLKSGDTIHRRILSAINVDEGISDSELRAKRRARMRSVSDEALHDLEAYTALIYRARRGP